MAAEPHIGKSVAAISNLHNEPTWLESAHQRLDTEVLAAYERPQDLEDEQVLERLLALSLSRD